MAESGKRPSTRDRRPRSAMARLTPPGPKFEEENIAKQAKERVKSAKANKSKHTSSAGVFVRPPSRAKGAPPRFKTMYSQDFDGTFVPPAEPRPTSPTRRNNPHPTKQFMVWRVPSRETGAIPYEEGLELPPEYLARNADFDAIDELGNSLGGLKLPPAMPSSTDYGAYLRRKPASRQGRKLKPVSDSILGHVVQNGNESALENWLQTATPEEQHTVLKMFKSAEEAQVKQTINKVMQPEAARAVEGWLEGAGEKEKEVAVRLFSSLGSRPGQPAMRQRSLSDSDGYYDRPPSRKLATPVYKPTGVGGSRSRRVSAPPGARPPQPWPAGIWHHKPVRDPPPQVYHRGSLFGAVKGDTSHFNIHPEWPDYYGPGDAVH